MFFQLGTYSMLITDYALICNLTGTPTQRIIITGPNPGTGVAVITRVSVALFP